MTKATSHMEDSDMDDGDTGSVWVRGLWVLLFGLMFSLSRAVLYVVALVQFGWQVVQGETNQPIADFGRALAEWQAATSRYMTAASDARPFPLASWGKVEEL